MTKQFQGFADCHTPGQPRAGRQPQWVQCDNSMRLAVLDESGKWKSFSSDRELTDFVRVCPG